MTDLLRTVLDLVAALPGDVPPDPWEDPPSGGPWVVPAVPAVVVGAGAPALTEAVVPHRRRR